MSETHILPLDAVLSTIAIAPCCRRQSVAKLVALRLYGQRNAIYVSSGAVTVGRFKHLNSLEIVGGTAFRDVAFLSRMRGLKILSFGDRQTEIFFRNDAMCGVIPNLQKLEKFSNVRRGEYGPSITILPRFPPYYGLKYLDSNIQRVSDLKPISELSELISLRLRVDNCCGTQEDTDLTGSLSYPYYLVVLKKLEILELSTNHINDAADRICIDRHFAGFFKNDISHQCPGIALMQSLKTLGLEFSAMTNNWMRGISCLANLENLRIRTFKTHNGDYFATVIFTPETLRTLAAKDTYMSSMRFIRMIEKS